jgi:hypothetical protein
MGIKDIFKRWSKAEDADAEARSTQGIDEDYEATKDDAMISSSFAGGEATEAAGAELADD